MAYYVEMLCTCRKLICIAITILFSSFNSLSPRLPFHYLSHPKKLFLEYVVLWLSPGRGAGLSTPGESPRPGGASAAPWRDVLVTHLSLERRHWPFPGSLGTGTEKTTCKWLSHCREEGLLGPEGKLIKDLIQPTCNEKH